MTYHKCNISSECGLTCLHNENHPMIHDPRGGPEDCRERHHCPPMDSMVFCEPIKPELCPACGAARAVWAETLGGECCLETVKANARQLGKSTLREANVHKIMEKNSHPGHFGNPGICPVCFPETAAVASGREATAKRIMEENGETVPDTMTASVYKANVRAIIHEVVSSTVEQTVYWKERSGIVEKATAKIMKLPGERDSDLLTEIAQFRDSLVNLADTYESDIDPIRKGKGVAYKYASNELTDLLKRHGYEG